MVQSTKLSEVPKRQAPSKSQDNKHGPLSGWSNNGKSRSGHTWTSSSHEPCEQICEQSVTRFPEPKAPTVATKLIEEFVARFGVPLELHSDQGREFESAVFREMCSLLGVKKTQTTPYHPRSNGMIK